MTRFATDVYRSTKDFVISNRRVVVTLIHLVQAAVANYIAFILRFESIISPSYLGKFIQYLPLLLVIRLVFYLQAGLYKNLWRYASISDLVKIVRTAVIGSAVFYIIVRHISGDLSYPRSIFVLDTLLLVVISGGSRLMVRIFREYLKASPSGKSVIIIGAGDAGEMIVRDMINNPQYAYRPVGFIDDDPYKKGLSIHGVPILGPMQRMAELVEKQKPDELIIAMPSTGYKAMQEIYELCKPLNLPIKTLPGLHMIMDGSVSVSQVKPLSLEDLLQREPVLTDIEAVREFIGQKSVMVTGAGGSIGSELARQIIRYGPKKLVLYDRYENGLFMIDGELKGVEHSAEVLPVVGDILDARRLEHVFTVHGPDIVFHAAAHKHVPMMELNPVEAVKNNVLGTKTLLEAAERHGVENFVQISTDKAVNPIGMMGASKRAAELLAMRMNEAGPAKVTTVRFGNVLGSSGSVVHLFREQIKAGGPVTVTHPDVKRFFMLLEEAVQLVLIAAAAGGGGEIFVLDMGEQIKLVDFAENLIRLSGFVPNEDIMVEFIGLRPGEKLYEELLDETEQRMPTFHDKLHIAVPRVSSAEDMDENIALLEQAVDDYSAEEVIRVIKKIVPSYRTR